MLRTVLRGLGDDAGGSVLEADGGLALVAMLAAGAGGLEGVHVALRHELVFRQLQVVGDGIGGGDRGREGPDRGEG